MKVKRVKSNDGKKLQIILNTDDHKVAKVGWFQKLKYDEPPENPYVAEIAAQNEFGNPSKKIPARPFFRPTIENKKTEWQKLLEQGASAVLKGKIPMTAVLEAVSLKAAGDVRKAITEVYSPALSPVTIQRRLDKRANGKVIGNLTKPLIETKYMLTTLINSVENE